MPTARLLNPHTFDSDRLDPESRRQLQALIAWFEERGKTRLLRDDLDAAWVSDFLDFVKRERLFATFLTPSEFAGGKPRQAVDTSRNAVLSEILGFYGLSYWYAEQVTILGLGPIWQATTSKQGEGRRATGGRRSDGVRAVGARTRRRHLQHGPGADRPLLTTTKACCSGRPGRSTTSQRQRGRHGVGVRAARRRRRVRRLRLVRRGQLARELRADRQRRARSDVRQHLCAARLSGVRGGHPGSPGPTRSPRP